MKKLLIAILFMAPFQAHAIPITISGTTYQLTTITGRLDILGAQVTDNSPWQDPSLPSVIGAITDTGLANTLFFREYLSPSRFNAVSCTPSCQATDFSTSTSYTFAVVAPATTVPEPSTLGLFGAGLLGVGIMRLRRKRAV